MLCEVPLTKEQQAFATDHHGLVSEGNGAGSSFQVPFYSF